jgi:hypothetical protein
MATNGNEASVARAGRRRQPTTPCRAGAASVVEGRDRATRSSAVEYSVRAAQMAVDELLGVRRKVPPVTRHDKSIRVKFEAFVKAFQ